MPKITKEDLLDSGLEIIKDGKREKHYSKGQLGRIGDPHPFAGSRIFWCGDGIEPCQECMSPSDYQCDFPVGDGKTCDFYLCEKHAHKIGEDKHLCPIHFKMYQGEE